ncbi:MAG: hypothetical protein Q9162_001746 [Coniocarpon cinnabarinum]
MDPSSDSGKVFQALFDTLNSRPGFQRAVYGNTLEDPTALSLFIDWDDVQNHKDFMASAEYGPLMKNLGALLTAPPVLYHAHFQPHPAPATMATVAPVTEVVLAHFDPSISDADKKSFSTAFDNLANALQANAPGNGHISNSYASGWSLENNIPFQGGQTTVYAAVFGWESKDVSGVLCDADVKG